jgi:hypothetical protein
MVMRADGCSQRAVARSNDAVGQDAFPVIREAMRSKPPGRVADAPLRKRPPCTGNADYLVTGGKRGLLTLTRHRARQLVKFAALFA